MNILIQFELIRHYDITIEDHLTDELLRQKKLKLLIRFGSRNKKQMNLIIYFVPTTENCIYEKID